VISRPAVRTSSVLHGRVARTGSENLVPNPGREASSDEFTSVVQA
jgi:hypothetical protein